MAEKKHEIVEFGNVNRNGKGAVSSSVARGRRFVVASVKVLFGSSKKGGAVQAPKLLERSTAMSSSSSSVCSSARIERMMQSRTEFAREVDFEIEASKDHWSELEQSSEESSSSDERRVHLTNGEIVESFRSQFPEWGDLFRDGAGFVEVGEKIAEGAQAEIFTAKVIGPPDHGIVLKVFKEGPSMSDLQKQWPLGMLNLFEKRRKGISPRFSSLIHSGTVVMNGRFAFLMHRYWGDLRKLIDRRMEYNNNQCPPLKDDELEWNMIFISMGMKGLHEDNIIHRDLKASNVLIFTLPHSWRLEDDDCNRDIVSDFYSCEVGDYECSVGVVGTGFWRAPEILQGVKDRKITSDLFTKKSDVYSFAMTCYEMVSGQIPFEELPLSDYDTVLQGGRPILPKGLKPWIKELLNRCWHSDPIERPNFVDIVNFIQDHRPSRLRLKPAFWEIF